MIKSKIAKMFSSHQFETVNISKVIRREIKNIFLESAHFEPRQLRRTSTRHLLRTDAAKCFEKGADPNNNVFALKRAALPVRRNLNMRCAACRPRFVSSTLAYLTKTGWPSWTGWPWKPTRRSSSFQAAQWYRTKLQGWNWGRMTTSPNRLSRLRLWLGFGP